MPAKPPMRSTDVAGKNRKVVSSKRNAKYSRKKRIEDPLTLLRFAMAVLVMRIG
jgi:hypothetical protein